MRPVLRKPSCRKYVGLSRRDDGSPDHRRWDQRWVNRPIWDDCTWRRWSDDQASVDGLSCVEHASLAATVHSCPRRQIVVSWRVTAMRIIGREGLKLIRLQIAGSHVWLQCACPCISSAVHSTLGLSSMLKLAVKDYFGGLTWTTDQPNVIELTLVSPRFLSHCISAAVGNRTSVFGILSCHHTRAMCVSSACVVIINKVAVTNRFVLKLAEEEEVRRSTFCALEVSQPSRSRDRNDECGCSDRRISCRLTAPHIFHMQW